MITEDLIFYIQSQLRKNISKDIIISKLKKAGWHDEDIGEAFFKLNPPTIKKIEPQIKIEEIAPINVEAQKPSAPDFYREPIGDEKEVNLSEPRKIIPQYKPEPQIVKPVFVRSFSEANKTYKPLQTSPKIESTLEIQNQELMPGLIPKTPRVDISSQPKVVIEDKKEQSIKQPTDFKQAPQVSPFSDSPNSAILHSYPQALLYANKLKENIPKESRTNKKGILKWIVALFIVGILGGAIFAFSGNYFKLPSFNLSLIKKDPKLLIASAPITLSELSSYKTKTTFTLTAPSFADITMGLLSGEKTNSKDKDFISFESSGIVSSLSPSSKTFSYKTILESSMFEDKVSASIKYSRPNSIISIENLSTLLGQNAPKVSNLNIADNQFDQIIDLWDGPSKNFVSKLNIEKLISIAIPSYIDDDVSVALKGLANKSSILEKKEESIEGIPSYHYEIIADKDSSKEFIKNFIKIFTNNLSMNDEELINDRLGATTIDSFEIWVGKDDSKIHQYKLSISTPLSRLIGLEDKGISGNIVNLDMKTTYYDFNIKNDILLPENTSNFEDFVRQIKDMKIKDKLISFKPLADSFKNSTGNFGTKINSSGSCKEPNSGSLFSPIGHKKSASSSVGIISSFMQNMTDETLAEVSCYSTASAWAMSYPMLSVQNKYFCVDSKGYKDLIDTSISGPICK
jgi:hypothetical protein